jgi:Dolichyl-phosphate-mannose-protein mannosyltransferase
MADTPEGKKSIALSVTSCFMMGLLLAVILSLSTRGMLSEGTISMNGDMPRHLMNGALILDFFRELPLADPLGFVYRYYATYPALSLGFHSPLLPMAEAPLFALLGVSVFSGRVVILAFLLAGVWAWFSLIRLVFDRKIAFLSSLLLVTNPCIVRNSRIVMTDIPALSMVMITVYLFERYSRSKERTLATLFLLSLLLTTLARPQTLFMIAVYLLHAVTSGDVRRFKASLTSTHLLLSCVLLVGMIAVALRFGTHNVSWLMHGFRRESFFYPLECLGTYHFDPFLLLAAAAGLIIIALQKDGRITLFMFWIGCCYLQAVAIGPSEPRYSIYWIPPFCLLAALLSRVPGRQLGTVATLIIVTLSVNQFIAAFAMEPHSMEGYHEAAQYLSGDGKGKRVLYSSDQDTGYLCFFTRALDPSTKSMILRADKILATSNYNRIVENRVVVRGDLYAIMKNLGIDYVVVQGGGGHSISLNLLRDEVKTDHFRLLNVIPVHPRSGLAGNSDIAIYEFREHALPKPDAKLEMNLPLVNRRISVRMDELPSWRP